jgi:hypothetical protein
VLLLDGLHTDYAAGKPGPAESALDAGHLGIFLKFARDAVARRKTMVVIHSEIIPGTYASTTETADWLLARLKLTRRPLPRPAPRPIGHARDERGPGRQISRYGLRRPNRRGPCGSV